MLKYMLCPGFVRGSDGGLHYVNAHELARLYNVPLRECAEQPAPGTLVDHLIHLYPRRDGRYDRKVNYKPGMMKEQEDFIHQRNIRNDEGANQEGQVPSQEVRD